MSENTGNNPAKDLKRAIDAALEAGKGPAAHALLVEYWHEQAGPAAAAYVLAAYGAVPAPVDRIALKIAVLRSFTVEPAFPVVRAAALTHHLGLEIIVGDHNTYAQDILTPDGLPYEADIDAVILAVNARDIAPDLWGRFTSLSEAAVADTINSTVEAFESLFAAFRERSDKALVVHNLEQPPETADGILDAQNANGQQSALRRINSSIREAASRYKEIYVLDYDALVSRYGRRSWNDEGRWMAMRMPIASEHLAHLADEWLKFLMPIAGCTCKALILDLDNTLWGGVVGEDGLDGIKLDGEFPGAAFQAVQAKALDLYERGVILGICSKNNPDDALAAIESHPGMLLKPQHFAAIRANWQDKATNLKEIAEELSIGTDALALLDDNPVERLWVRGQMPEVTVIAVPDDPLALAPALATCPAFERLSLTDDDRQRGRFYAEERERTEHQASLTSVEDYYRSLQMSLDVSRPDAGQILRISQLTQRTNQFNMTTRRYSEQEIGKLMDDPKVLIYAARSSDRFGDNGIIGAIILRLDGKLADIDTLLLSCRVIGRTIETAFLAAAIQAARAKGVRQLRGHFLPTAKNAPAKDFFEQNGFTCTEQTDNGSIWEADIEAALPAIPEWVACQFDGEDLT